MLISKNLMLSVILFVAVVFVSVLIYLFVRSYLTNKRVKEAERAHELIFLANVQAQRREKELAERGELSGAIVYKPEGHIADFQQKPFTVRHETTEDIPDSAEKSNETLEEFVPTRKLSEFFE